VSLVTPTRPTPIIAALAIALGYYLGARLGFALTLAPVPVSTLWPPNAILMAGLVLVPVRQWPVVFGAVFGAHLIVQFQSGVPAAMVLSWFVSNCTEALIGAALFRRFGHGARSFDSFQGTLVFLVCGGVAAPILSSFLDAGLVTWNGWGDSGFWRVWCTRVSANVLAAITLVPVILTAFETLSHRIRPDARTVAKVSAGMTALIGVCWFVFVQYRAGRGPLRTARRQRLDPDLRAGRDLGRSPRSRPVRRQLRARERPLDPDLLDRRVDPDHVARGGHARARAGGIERTVE
jgi:integral membrane sensor domain MASE1